METNKYFELVCDKYIKWFDEFILKKEGGD